MIQCASSVKRNRSSLILQATILFFIAISLFAQESIIFTPYQDSEGKPIDKAYAIQITDMIQLNLVKDKTLNVLERNRLFDLIEEQKLAESGLINEATAIKAGQMIGANVILLGQISELEKNKVAISTRLIEIECGKILNQWNASEIKIKDLDQYIDTVSNDIIQLARKNRALKNIAALENEHSVFQVEMIANQESLVFGDFLELKIKPNDNCYIYVFDVGTSGKIHLLFPNKIKKNNFVEKADSVIIGPLRVGPPAGAELVKAIATLDSMSLEKMMDVVNESATFQQYDEDAQDFSRDLELIVTPLSEDRWTSSTVQLMISEK